MKLLAALVVLAVVYMIYIHKDKLYSSVEEAFSLHPALEYGTSLKSVPGMSGAAYAPLPGLPRDGPLPWLYPEDPVTMKGPRRGDGSLAPTTLYEPGYMAIP